MLSLNIPSINFEPAARVMLIAFSLGAGVIGAIYAFGDISGGHFNPAVTVGLWVSGRFMGRDVIPYIVARLLGRIVGVATIGGVAYSSSSL